MRLATSALGRLAFAAIACWLATVGASQASDELVAKLEQEGFFRYATADEAAATKKAIQNNGWAGVYSIQSRLVGADSEDLGEGGVCHFLRGLSFLTTQNATVKSCADEYGEEGKYATTYQVVIDGVRFPIWDSSDLARETRSVGWLWGISAKRVADILNARLANTNSSERAYGLYGGDDFHFFFLTPTLRRLIAEHARAEPQEIPYNVTDEYPSFGAKTGMSAL